MHLALKSLERLSMLGKQIKVGNVILDNNVIIAPMAGVSDISFRSMLIDFKPGLMVSEMISDKGILYKNERTLEMCKTLEHEHPISLQLFGRDLETMIPAAKFLDKETDCDIIDINMGCPVAKVVSTNGGSSLLKEPEHAYELVKAIVEAVDKPVTVKMRVGWDSTSINAVEFAKLMEKAGAKMIAIHGRTRSQKYKGDIYYDVIRDVKNAVSIPVLGNGDITDIASARHMMETTGVDGVMIGRAILNNPWLIEEVKADFFETEYAMTMTNEDRFKWLRSRFIKMIEITEESHAVKKMRGFSTWFIAGLPDSKALKSRFIRMNSVAEFDRIVEEYLEERNV